MGKDKIRRYKEVETFDNVTDMSGYRPGHQVEIRSKWSVDVFGNTNPITLELACGKGDYALALARRYPERNFIGIDIKGERLWAGAGEAIEDGIKNVHFIRGRIDHINAFFSKNEISEIWITFPDPFLKNRRRNRRLTHPDFLDKFSEVLKDDGPIHLKTDSPELFEFTNEVIDAQRLPRLHFIEDVYALETVPELLAIKTYYEKKHLRDGRTIRFVSFLLKEMENRC